jgi:hypothetical protein
MVQIVKLLNLIYTSAEGETLNVPLPSKFFEVVS